jgi:hypothetical protein
VCLCTRSAALQEAGERFCAQLLAWGAPSGCSPGAELRRRDEVRRGTAQVAARADRSTQRACIAGTRRSAHCDMGVEPTRGSDQPDRLEIESGPNAAARIGS